MPGYLGASKPFCMITLLRFRELGIRIGVLVLVLFLVLLFHFLTLAEKLEQSYIISLDAMLLKILYSGIRANKLSKSGASPPVQKT